MKKIALAFLVALSLNVAAQENTPKPKKFAVFFGVNNSFFSEDKPFGAMHIQPNFGKQTGVLYNLQLNNTISFRPKLMYSEQGDRDPDSWNTDYISSPEYCISYINAAMDFKFWNRIYLLAGPQIGVVIAERSPHDIGPAKSVDIGANLGLGFTIHRWFFEFGAYTGFTPAIEYRNRWGKEQLINGHSKFTVGYHIF